MKKHTTSALIPLRQAFGKQEYMIYDQDYKEQLLTHPLVKGLFTPGDSFVIVANTNNWEFEIVTGQVEKVTGFTKEEVSKLRAEFVMNFSIKEHVPINLATVKAGMEYLHTRPAEERDYIFAVYYYKAQKKNGEIIDIQHQSIPLVFDENKIPFIFCNIYSDISYLNSANIPQCMMMNKYTNEVFHVNVPEQKLEKRPELFTDREKEIIRHIKRGLTSPQIAVKLNISSDTVRTHRKNIFKKAGVSSAASLINYTVAHGIL